MDLQQVRTVCLSLPHVTEQVQWENDLVFKVGGKMFAVLMLEPGEYVVSFKCSPEDYAQLVERPGVSPAPYLARAHWVALENFSSLPPGELRTRLGEAHALVFAKLPKRVQAELNRGSGAHRS